MQQNLFGGVVDNEVVEPNGMDEDGNIDTGIETEEEFDINTEQDIKVEDTPYYTEFSNWEKACKKAKESYTYMQLSYRGNLAKQWISSTNGLEREWRGTSESYGGSWGTTGYEDTELGQLKDDIIEFYEDQLDKPYCRAVADDWAIRGIRKENIRVFYDDKVLDFIKEKGGWDLREVIKEMESAPEREYDADFQLLAKEYYDSKEELEKVKKTKWDVEHKLQKHMGYGWGGYSSNEVVVDVDGDIIKALYNQQKKLRQDEKDLELKVEKLRSKLVRGY